jgi:minor extracellular serine protease Vpr
VAGSTVGVRVMKRSVLSIAAAVSLAVAASLSGGAVSPAGSAHAPPSGGPAYALVQLSEAPLAVSPKTRPTGGQKINLRSEAVRSHRAALAQQRSAFKSWLRANAPKAKVTSEFDLALNAVGVQLNGASLSELSSAPGVLRVEQQSVYTPIAHDDPDLGLVHAAQAWSQAGGEANAGAGVKVAVIDSGIDASHPCFDDTGYPNVPQTGPAALTNNKVIVARVYGNKIAKEGLDPSAVDSHGTHVAGTVACNAHTPAVVNGVDIPYDPSGVAPRALLGNYNVFPGTTGSARSEDILEAMEDAYEDGFDVMNMSLGGARNDGGGAFLLDNAVDNIDRANVVVAVAAGNEGPGYFTVHYPGAAPRALTAGASTVGHGVINLVTVGGVDYEAVFGDFAVPETDLSAPLAVVPGTSGQPHGLSTACDTDPPLPPLTGEIALLGRGICDFTVKMRNAQNAGAVGVIMVDHTEEAPFVMAHNGLEAQPTIPGAMVRLSDGAVLDGQDGATATLRALGEYVTQPDATNLVAGFSSWGPTHGDLLIKPDVTAPGADVLSSFPASHCDPLPPEGCWSFLGGTSMATPHLAGAAAVVRGIHPDWSAAHVRSAIVNTAQQHLLRHPETDAVTNDALIVGSGLLDVSAAGSAVAGFDPVSQSFGSVPSRAGRTVTRSFAVTNLGIASHTFSLAVTDDAADGVTFGVGGGSFTLAPGATRTVSVTATSARGATDGHHQATLRISTGGSEVAHAMLYLLVGTGDAAPGQHQLPPPKA